MPSYSIMSLAPAIKSTPALLFQASAPSALLLSPIAFSIRYRCPAALASNPAPGAGLAANAAGQRYLILNAIGDSGNTDGADAWKSSEGSDLIAGANDIIEYDGTKLEVKFDSSNESGVQYITNTNTGIQYKWTGSSWVKSYEGEYRAGDWSLVI